MRRPSASVFKTSTVFPLAIFRISPGRMAGGSGYPAGRAIAAQLPRSPGRRGEAARGAGGGLRGFGAGRRGASGVPSALGDSVRGGHLRRHCAQSGGRRPARVGCPRVHLAQREAWLGTARRTSGAGTACALPASALVAYQPQGQGTSAGSMTVRRSPARSATRRAAAMRPDIVAIGMPGPGWTLPPAR